MRLSLASCAVLAVALPALADNAYLTDPILAQLTALDTAPSASSIASSYANPALAETSLANIALDASVDVGIRIRAMRTLAGYCVNPCGTGTVHDNLMAVINAYQAHLPAAGSDLLLLRAAVESVGAARAIMPDDVAGILQLLAHPSRDLRATAARALRATCTRQVLTAVIAAQRTEASPQVLHELSSTEESLDACAPP